MEEGAQLAIYDPKVETSQIISDLTHPAYTDFSQDQGQCFSECLTFKGSQKFV